MFVGVPWHFHSVTELEFAGIVGIRSTVMLVPPTLPVTVICPLVSLTTSVEAYFVEVKPEPHVLRFDAPADCTISVTQVRAPLAASTISDAFARFV